MDGTNHCKFYCSWYNLFYGKIQTRENYSEKTLIFTRTNHQVLKDHVLLFDEIKKATTIDAIKAEVLKINRIKNEVTVLVTYEASKERI